MNNITCTIFKDYSKVIEKNCVSLTMIWLEALNFFPYK